MDLLTDPIISGIADKNGCSAAQVILAWHIAKGFPVIPKASDVPHLKDNLQAMDVELDGQELAAIDALDDTNGWLGPHPDTM